MTTAKFSLSESKVVRFYPGSTYAEVNVTFTHATDYTLTYAENLLNANVDKIDGTKRLGEHHIYRQSRLTIEPSKCKCRE